MEKTDSRVSVLFVCTGNICRSPTAEAVFRHQIRAAGLEDRFTIGSAGTHGYHIGDPSDARAIATAQARGVDMRDLRARKVKVSDFKDFDYILAMDKGHHRLLSQYMPGKAELSLFLDKADVPDPYYGTLQGFEEVYDLIEAGSRAFLDKLRKTHGF